MKNCEKRRIREAADKEGSSAPAQQGLAGDPFYRHLPAAAERPVGGVLAVFAPFLMSATGSGAHGAVVFYVAQLID